MSTQAVYQGNNLDLLARLPDCSVHAVVTDPPYGLSFMGRDWDKALPDPRTWSECLRVLRPGGHLVAFGAPRLYHRLTCQIEDAGFEIRDALLWLFGSGFPKSLDVSKAIDKEAGAVRVRVPATGGLHNNSNLNDDGWAQIGNAAPTQPGPTPATPEAAEWSGWGTALKPAYEPIVLARKPLDGTVASNVQRWGTGAINVDGCRIEATDPEAYAAKGASVVGLDSARNTTTYGASNAPRADSTSPLGRWPANLILSDEGDEEWRRYFYSPKASRSEREAGLEGLPPRVVDESRTEDSAGRNNPRAGAGRKGDGRRNHHPTVKPIELMRWLVRLVTPPGGIVVEPFAGSGTTPSACALADVDCIAMEIAPDYVEISRARVEHYRRIRASSSSNHPAKATA